MKKAERFTLDIVTWQPWIETSPVRSDISGASENTPRETLSPILPLTPAGIRIEPPPSLPCAIDTMPAATAAAEPPLEPPGDRLIAAVVDDFIDRIMDDPRLNANSKVDEAHHRVSKAGVQIHA